MKTSVNSRLHVDWFARCEPPVDEALAALPEQPDYPLELHSLLLHSPSQKRIAVVRRGDEPLAVVGLRPMGRGTWQPLTHWLLPGAPFPAQPGTHAAAIDALPLDLWVAGWRWDAAVPRLARLRLLHNSPVYCADLTSDLEAYWRSTKLYKTLRNARNHCKGFQTVRDHPGALDWTVRSWEERWCCDPSAHNPDLDDRLLAYHYMQDHGLLHTFALLDGGEVIAGNVVLLHRGEVVAGVLCNTPAYHKCKTGHVLIDMAFAWAVENGYKVFDIGGDHAYKHEWAPQNGGKWQLHVSPAYRYYPRLALQKARGVAGRMRELFRHPPHPPAHPNPV